MYQVPAIAQYETRQQTMMQQVYAWMAGGLGITALAAWWAYSSHFIENLLATSPGILFGLMIAEVALVIALSWAIGRLSPAVAAAMFGVYSLLNGLTLSVIFLVYTQASIATTFVVTAGTFAGMSLYGYTTKRDLTTIGSYLRMALLGFIIGSIVNFFWASSALYWFLTYAGIAIFIGLTAYDTQKLKRMAAQVGTMDERSQRKIVILGALTLYLDFINLLLLLLRVLGRRN